MDGISPHRKQFSPAPPILNPDEIKPGEDEDNYEEGEEIDEETAAVLSSIDLRIQPPITESHGVALMSPIGRRGGGKRKKGRGRGKSKPSAKKQQMIESRLRVLRRNLNPVPFIPHKTLNFAHHENLLKKLGLWEFIQIDFDRTIRVEFIAQLVANYNAKSRVSHVNGCRIRVNRADLARAVKLPLQSKKQKSNAGGAVVDLDWEDLSDDSIGFVLGLLSDWVLLHEDIWMMPHEVAEWMKLIKEGRPEKVDWPGLLWLMVEKELKQGSQLRDCYYASHLQQLIKFQYEKLFLMEEPVKDEVDLVAEADKEGEDGDNDDSVKDSDAVESVEEGGEGNSVVHGPSTELTLGQDGEKEEGAKDEEGGVKDLEMIDAEKCKHSDEEVGGEAQDQKQWFLTGKDNLGEHVLQRCRAENVDEFGNFEDRKGEEDDIHEDENDDDGVEDEVQVARNNHHVFPNDDFQEGDGFTGNFLQGLEGNQSSVDGYSGKRVIEQDYPLSLNDNHNKRMRINETWDNKPLDFAMCMDQIQLVSQRARMLYEEKVQGAKHCGMNRQILLNELQKRDAVIDRLHKARMEETQKKDVAINRLERELYLMGSVVDGYRKALKETREAFAKYKERAQLPEEIGKEEVEMKCFEGYVSQYDETNLMDKRLMGQGDDAKELVALHWKRKTPPTAAETLPFPESMEEEAVAEEVSELVPVPVPEAAANHQPSPHPDAKVVEVAEPLSV